MTDSSSLNIALLESKTTNLSFVDQALSNGVFISARGHLQRNLGSRLTKRTVPVSLDRCLPDRQMGGNKGVRGSTIVEHEKVPYTRIHLASLVIVRTKRAKASDGGSTTITTERRRQQLQQDGHHHHQHHHHHRHDNHHRHHHTSNGGTRHELYGERLYSSRCPTFTRQHQCRHGQRQSHSKPHSHRT